jgi:hypothetical protein
VNISKPAALLCAASMLVFAAHARAQDSAPPAAVEDQTPSVTPYTAAFFAPFRPNSAMDMIGLLPGFSFDGGSGGRGFAGTGGNVLIDGERPPSRNDSLSSILDRIPAGSVARIELVRGGAGGLDMQGHTIIANVIRKKGAGVQGSVEATFNVSEFGELYPHAQLQLQSRRNGRSLEGSLTLDSDDYTIRARGERRGPDGDLLRRYKHEGDQHNLSYQATGGYEDDLAGGRLRVNTRLEHHWTDRTDPDRFLFPGDGEVDDYRSHGTSGELGLRFNRDVFKTASIELVGFQQLADESFLDDYRTPDLDAGTVSLRRSGESIVDAKFTAPLSPSLGLETGLEGVFNFVDAATSYTLDGEPLALSGDSSRVEELRGEGFVTATWRPRPTFSLESGLRYEYSTISARGTAGSSEKTLAFPKPRAVLTWSPNARHQLVVSIERSIGQLDFDSFLASASFSTGVFGVGNADVVPDKTWTYQARYEYRFADRGSFLLQYTRDHQTDVLGRVVVELTPPGSTTPDLFEISRNIVEIERNTLVANADLPLDALGMNGGLLELKTTFQNAPTHDPVTGEPRNSSGTEAANWSIDLSQNITSLNLEWSLGADSGDNHLQFSPHQITHVENMWRLGGSVTWKPTPGLSLTAGASNVNGGYNVAYTTFYDAPRPDGQIAYTEVNRDYNKSQVYVALRRSF